MSEGLVVFNYLYYDDENKCITIPDEDRKRFLDVFKPFLNIDTEKTQLILNYARGWDGLAITKDYSGAYNLYINIFDDEDMDCEVYTHWERVTDNIITDRNFERVKKIMIMQEFTLYNDTRLNYEEIIATVKGKYDFHDM